MNVKISKSHEDYLEAIVELGGTPENPIRSVDVATNLGVSKASVNKAVTALKEMSFLDQPYYGDITLTEKGYETGMAVLKRHRLLYQFLTKEVGIPEEVADKEACIMEHAISDASFKKWVAYIKRIERCHPGCPIYNKDSE